ncbi:uncharacterized protein LOC119391200 [Rhipicephalus sanguineus]|uniref:uncharacterized protein LOC119391200 n=1 Tax=Rhipicephalus sanguineus TaxID=34632 RepID=UPI0020C45CC8|nr:uncharacterized protein LOC119391200 [Rhipicephalus sanguineus]
MGTLCAIFPTITRHAHVYLGRFRAQADKTLFTDDVLDVLDVAEFLDSVDFPCLVDDDTMEFLRSHGRILFLSRGPPGSGKGTVASKLLELYPGSRICWSHNMFLDPLAPPRTEETLRQSHDLCRQKITEYMQQNVPVIINKNTNMMMWEMSNFLRMAATYGYTVIILDVNKNFVMKPEALAVTNSEKMDQYYLERRLKQWEDAYPYAMGWSPRPRDAAFLLRRYKELLAELAKCGSGIGLKAVQHAQFFPFCVARVCWFGWDERDRNYCCSEMVKKAYGSKDTITVLGYAVVGDLVMAVVELSEAQASLIGDSEQPASLETAISRYADGRQCDEVLCTVELHDMFAQNESDETVVSEEGAARCELPPSSRVSFIVLGSATAKAIKYSSAVLRASLLRYNMRSWRDTGAAPWTCVDVDGVSVMELPKTVRLDAVFTGYYQAHTTRASGRDQLWSTGQFTATIPHEQPDSCPTDAVKQLPDFVDSPCLNHDATRRFLRTHGRLFILVRGSFGSGRDTVIARLKQVYAGSRSPTGSSRASKYQISTTASTRFDATLNEIESFMKDDVPMLYRYTDIMVWHITKYLALASKYGYTVILVDMPHQPASDPKVLYKAMGESKQENHWEEVYPFAMGWSPRPKDAAWLLRRFWQIRNALHDEDPALTPRDIASSYVYPFCLARLCLFGCNAADKEYCQSEKVKHAYGRSDTLRVFGYAVTQGFVFVMVELTDDQASLIGHIHGVWEADRDVDAVTRQLSLSAGFQTWEEVACTVDVAKFTPTEGCTDEDCLHLVGNKINLKDVQPSRITFMPLGSVDGTDYSYSKAVGAPWLLLCSKLRSWRAAKVNCSRSVNDIEVYGSAVSTGDACLLVIDHATVELDVVFTGYYQPHRTSLSGHSWSSARNAGSTAGRPPNRGGR